MFSKNPNQTKKIKKISFLGDLEKLKQFINEGFGINQKFDTLPQTLAERSAIKSQFHILEYLIEQQADLSNVLHHSLHNLPIVKLLLENGADPNEKNVAHCPLHVAMWSGPDHDRIEVVKLLLEYKTDINALADKDSPLEIAVRVNHPKMIDLLLKNGANPYRFNNHQGYTALHQAAYDGKKEIVSCLLDNKVDIDVLTEAKRTPLHIAVWEQQMEMVKFLLEKGACPHKRIKREKPQ